MKLKKSQLPNGHNFNNFTFSGKFAEKDCCLENTEAAYLGSFETEIKNSNKFYFGCVCQSSVNNLWYSYFEWGRTGLKADYQFYEFSSKEDAIKNYKKQIESKNIKRGILTKHPILGDILKPKPGKDLYLIRKMAVISCNIPSVSQISTKKTVSKSSQFDQQTEALLRDLQTGTVSYTKSKFSSGMVPDLDSINQARTILSLAAKTNKDDELNELTKILYSKIPKSTYIGEKVELSSENIKSWYDDLDAFESAFNSLESGVENYNVKYLLKYIDKSNQLWYNIERLVKSSTRNRHSYIPGQIKIENIWEVTNIPKEFLEEQEKVAKEFNGTGFPLIFQPERTELEKRSNCQLLFHGSRSCNINSIISTGFKLPKELSGISINGAINGPALYHGLDYRKSVGYCSVPNSYWAKGSGTINGRKAFMFINDVILGNSYIISRPRPESNAPNGYHSVIADTTGSFQNEEAMSYDKRFVWPRFLLEFDI